MTPRRALIAVLDRMFGYTMRWSPGFIAYPLSGFVARHVAPRLYPRGQRYATENLPALRPDLPPEPALAAMWDNMGRTAMEAPRVLRMVREGRLRIHGAEHLRDLPVLVAGLHLGNWEMLGPALAANGIKATAVYQPLASKFRSEVLLSQRRPNARRLLPGNEPVARPALRALMEEKNVLLLFVDEFHGGVVHAPSLGRGPRRKGNIALAVRMARKSGAAMVLGYCLRSPGPVFDVHFVPVPLPDEQDAAIDALDAAMEAVIRPNITQWFMLHEWRPAG